MAIICPSECPYKRAAIGYEKMIRWYESSIFTALLVDYFEFLKKVFEKSAQFSNTITN